MTKLDGQYLDHDVPDDWQEWGIWEDREGNGGFQGMINKDGILYPFRFTRAEAERHQHPPYAVARPLPDYLPRVGNVFGA